MTTIELKSLGPFLHTRFEAASVREKLVDAWLAGDRLTLDFNKVEMMSSSFADECFGKLAQELGIASNELYKHFDFKNVSPIIRTRIDKAFLDRKVSTEREYAL
jgi:hypothetical protein